MTKRMLCVVLSALSLIPNNEDSEEDTEEDPSEERKPEDDDDDDDDTDEEVVGPLMEKEGRQETWLRLDSSVSTCWHGRLSDLSHLCQHPWRHALLSMLPHLLLTNKSPTYDQAPLGHRAAMIHMRDDIHEEDMPPQRRFVLTAPPPGCDVVESSASAAARAPRGQYDFVDAVVGRHGTSFLLRFLIRSPGHDTLTIARAADRAEDVGYVRALQILEL
ncbi:hypothetical protein Tco_0206037 [Tanacetum coccineum]